MLINLLRACNIRKANSSNRLCIKLLPFQSGFAYNLAGSSFKVRILLESRLGVRDFKIVEYIIFQRMHYRPFKVLSSLLKIFKL